jgi:hypothetical protein
MEALIQGPPWRTQVRDRSWCFIGQSDRASRTRTGTGWVKTMSPISSTDVLDRPLGFKKPSQVLAEVLR